MEIDKEVDKYNVSGLISKLFWRKGNIQYTIFQCIKLQMEINFKLANFDF